MTTTIAEAHGFSPYECVFLREPPNLLGIKCPDLTPMASSYTEYISLLKKRFEEISRLVLDKQTDTQIKQNETAKRKISKGVTFFPGQLCYLLSPNHSALSLANHKIKFSYIGILAIHSVLDHPHVTLMRINEIQKF